MAVQAGQRWGMFADAPLTQAATWCGRAAGEEGGRICSAKGWYRCSRRRVENPFSREDRAASPLADPYYHRNSNGCSVRPTTAPLSPNASRTAFPTTSSTASPYPSSNLSAHTVRLFDDTCRKQSFLSAASRVTSHSRVGLTASHVNQIHVEGVVCGVFIGCRRWEGEKGNEKNRQMRESLLTTWRKIEEEQRHPMKRKTSEEKTEGPELVRDGTDHRQHALPLSEKVSCARRSLWEADHLLPYTTSSVECSSSCHPLLTSSPTASGMDTTTTATTSSSVALCGDGASSLPPLHLFIWMSISDGKEEMQRCTEAPMMITCPLSPFLVHSLAREAIDEGEEKKEERNSIPPIATAPMMPEKFTSVESPLHHYFFSRLGQQRVIVSGQLRTQERYDGDLQRIIPVPYVLLPMDGFRRSIRVLG